MRSGIHRNACRCGEGLEKRSPFRQLTDPSPALGQGEPVIHYGAPSCAEDARGARVLPGGSGRSEHACYWEEPKLNFFAPFQREGRMKVTLPCLAFVLLQLSQEARTIQNILIHDAERSLTSEDCQRTRAVGPSNVTK